MSSFRQRVIDLVRMVPYGKVASYKQIALYAGFPRAAREVGWILNKTEGQVDLPWWRITNNKGYLSIRGTKFYDKMLQRKLLRAEGIPVSERFTFDIEQYRWIMSEKLVRKLQLPEKYFKSK
jgi:methylated-DNA-protein-cysteine methyltransferase-like protein